MSDNDKHRDLKKTEAQQLDNFEGYEEGVEGDDRPQGGRVIQGTCLKFTNDYRWLANDQEVSDKLELVVIDVARIVQKWKDQKPVETIFLDPGQKFPDVEEMNEREPRSEWREGPEGNMIGPWQAQHVAYMLNLETMERYTYPTGTIGGRIAVSELVRSVKDRRRFKGTNWYAVVTLDDTFMKTKRGGRQRPDLVIQRFIQLGADQHALSNDDEPRRLIHRDDHNVQRDGAARPMTKGGVQKVQPRSSKPDPCEDADLNDPIDDLLK